MAWAENFDQAWSDIEEQYSEHFRRMWHYYLYASAGFFGSRKGQLWQVVFAHPDRPKAYRSLR